MIHGINLNLFSVVYASSTRKMIVGKLGKTTFFVDIKESDPMSAYCKYFDTGKRFHVQSS